MALTKKPCPGCGRIDPERAANSVCHQCKRDLKLSKAYQVELELRKEQNTADTEWIKIPQNWYGLPSFCSDNLKKAIYDLILKLGKVLDKEDTVWLDSAQVPHKQYSRHYTNEYNKFVCVPKGIRGMLVELFEQIRLAQNKTYEDGKKFGRSILHRLANGDISMNDFFNR